MKFFIPVYSLTGVGGFFVQKKFSTFFENRVSTYHLPVQTSEGVISVSRKREPFHLIFDN